jgi:hypothetical protein
MNIVTLYDVQMFIFGKYIKNIKTFPQQGKEKSIF